MQQQTGKEKVASQELFKGKKSTRTNAYRHGTKPIINAD